MLTIPEKSGFSILSVLDKKESEKAISSDELSNKTNEIIQNTKQLHDGRWFWISVKTFEDAEDVKKLFLIKNKAKLR